MDKKPYKEEYDPLVGYIRTRFQQAETSRLYDEKRWLKAYRNYRGLYGPETAFSENEKSRVFVKITKTKVLASFGQIIEVLFSQGYKIQGSDLLNNSNTKRLKKLGIKVFLGHSPRNLRKANIYL